MKLTVVKIGGNVIDNPAFCEQFLKDFSDIPAPKILVHGGGKVATQVAEKLCIETVWWKAEESPIKPCWT